MTKKDLIFAAIAISVIGVFIFLSLIGRKPKPLTTRPEHAGITRDTPRETCWGCHTPDSPVWLRHPKKGKPPDQTTPCSACHKFPDAGVALIDPVMTREGVLKWLNRQQR